LQVLHVLHTGIETEKQSYILSKQKIYTTPSVQFHPKQKIYTTPSEQFHPKQKTKETEVNIDSPNTHTDCSDGVVYIFPFFLL
jgi:hypothetical protein